MTATPPARGDTAAAGLSPFAGADICAEAGFTVPTGQRRPVFDHDVWDLGGVTGLPVQMRPHERRLDFTRVRNPRWRLVAKEYLLALLAPHHERVRVLTHAYRTPRSLWTCTRRLHELTRWLNWLTGHGITSLAEVTDHHCRAFAIQRGSRTDTRGQAAPRLDAALLRESAAVVIDLASYGQLFTADRYTPGWRPWTGRTATAVTGTPPTAENKTRPVPTPVLQPLLAASLYMVDTLAPHIIELRRAVRQHAHQNKVGPRSHKTTVAALAAVIDRHVDEGIPLERISGGVGELRRSWGWDPDDPVFPVNLTAIAREAGLAAFRPERFLGSLRGRLENAVATVGTENPWGRDAALVPQANGHGQLPWTLPTHEKDVRNLAEYATTACIIVVAAVSGMRPGELMELRVGCRRPPRETAPGLFRYHLAGRIVKGQPLGGTHEEWVVIEEAHRAVAVAEQLLADPHDGDLLFSAGTFGLRYRHYRSWVNSPPGQRLGLAPIPDEPVNLRMLRRTLAIELAYRPGGLLAAKIHLKHISVVTTEGYAARPGGSQARLLAEVGNHEQQRNLDLVLAEFRHYQEGILPSGPGARELVEFFAAVDGASAAGATIPPNLAASDQEVRNLLAKRAGILHLGTANYCWFADPSKALCLKLAGTPGADRPLIGMCDSARCPQATHHTRHRDVWAATAENTKVFLGGLGRGQKTEKARLQAHLGRAERILDGIDAASGAAPAPTAEGS